MLVVVAESSHGVRGGGGGNNGVPALAGDPATRVPAVKQARLTIHLEINQIEKRLVVIILEIVLTHKIKI